MNSEDVVRGVIESYKSRDLNDVLSRFSEDVHYSMNAVPGAADYAIDTRSKAEMAQMLTRISEEWTIEAYEITDLIAQADRVATQSRIQYRRRGTERVVTSMLAHFWAVKDGLVTEIVEYHDTLAIRDAGLP
ncbi:MAG: nuclear transport factor 2 family protein [Pseudomonadota bacterium]